MRLTERRYKLGKIHLPHDAKARTFAAKHSAVEQFVNHFTTQHVGMVPLSKKLDRINAARVVISRCEFNKTRCTDGLDGLSNWTYEWNPDTKEFSKEPKHDWASHPSDAFSYGAQVMAELYPPVVPVPKIDQSRAIVAIAAKKKLTFDEACRLQDQRDSQMRRSRV